MEAWRKPLIFAAAIAGFLLAVLPRVLKHGLTLPVIIGGLVALVASVAVLTIVLRRTPMVNRTPDGKGLPRWFWWALGIALFLRLAIGLLDPS